MSEIAEQISTFLERGAGLISLFAVLVIVVGFVLASGRYAQRFRTAAPAQKKGSGTFLQGLKAAEYFVGGAFAGLDGAFHVADPLGGRFGAGPMDAALRLA